MNTTRRWCGPLCSWWVVMGRLGGVWNTRLGVGTARAGNGRPQLIETPKNIQSPTQWQHFLLTFCCS
ncbi:MAG: hypothetical protein HOE48_05095 [Candidatus Latescibacteria bacterium]|nr:hypothetical protein [Candidatus Latescibacterota bacterium]MBT4137268.1 hypothetical protein [Candidatus Latescibacterota bacterium]